MSHHDHAHGHAGRGGWQDPLEAFRGQKDTVFADDPARRCRTSNGTTSWAYRTFRPTRSGVRRRPGAADGEVLTIPTSDGDERRFVRAAQVTVEVEGQPVSFVLLAHEDDEGYFLPFRDATSGQESYGAGRYLDLEAMDGRVRVDFNLAYNPSCACDDSYPCPLPPPDNWVSVPIRAGEKNY